MKDHAQQILAFPLQRVKDPLDVSTLKLVLLNTFQTLIVKMRDMNHEQEVEVWIDASVHDPETAVAEKDHDLMMIVHVKDQGPVMILQERGRGLVTILLVRDQDHVIIP